MGQSSTESKSIVNRIRFYNPPQESVCVRTYQVDARSIQGEINYTRWRAQSSSLHLLGRFFEGGRGE